MEKNKRFRMIAYSGAELKSAFWGKVVFDVAGMRLKSILPALREHIRDRAVGIIDRTWRDASNLRAEGQFVTSPDGAEVQNLLAQGFPFEASVGIYLDEIEEVPEGEIAQVNGGVFVGPGIILRTSDVREISIVALGADAGTLVINLTAAAGGLGAHQAPPGFLGRLQEEWAGSSALQIEFLSSFGAFLAYREAERRGQLVVAAGKLDTSRIAPDLDLARAEWDRDPALRAEFFDNFKSYLAYLRADLCGQISL